MTTKNLFCDGRVRCALWVAFLGTVATLASCIVEPVGGPAYVATPVVQGPVVVEEGLIYYPNYEVYYDPGARMYWYSHEGNWVRGPAPVGVSLDVLLASPSARMDFRDSPANHHNVVVRQYPRNWRPDDHERRAN